MKRIETTCGYREEYDNGEIRYYSDWSGQGYCYKDDEAIKNKVGVAYIREAIFDMAHDDYGTDYVTGGMLEEYKEDCTTWDEMYQEAVYYFNEEIPEGYPCRKEFLSWVVEMTYEILDWQGFDVLLDEMDFDFIGEHTTPLPWEWKETA